MHVLTLALVALMLPFTAAPAQAGPCDSRAVIPVALSGSTFYVDLRQGNIVWIYQETNGQAGLQRGGTNLFGSKDTCVDDPVGVPDRALY